MARSRLGRDAILVPIGTTTERPSPPETGQIRFNTDEDEFEGYDGTQWDSIGGGPPAGALMYFAMDTAPDGWLKANGAEVSRSTYADLFSAIGTTFGAGNGSTTFELPDLRGEFMRGWDDGRGVDSGRSFGTSQLDQMQSHDHFSGMASNNNTRARDLIGEPRHGTVDTGLGGRGFIDSGSTNLGTLSGGSNREGLTSTVRSGREGDETRSRNVALLACIKH